MAESALGLIETRGLVGVIQAADTAAKAADVQLLGIEQVGGGLVSVRFSGDVAAVKAAVAAASRAVATVAELVSAHVIARPYTGMGRLLEDGPGRSGWAEGAAQGAVAPAASVALPGEPVPADEPDLAGLNEAELAGLSVTRLRQLARRTAGLGLQGRQISRANKEQLVRALNRAHDASGGSP